MTAPHFFAPEVGGDTVRLTGEEARHAARVLRVTPGELITVGDGRGTVVEARVVAAGASLVEGAVEGMRSVERAHPTVAVHPALPKSAKLDWVVQKLTEIGVDEIRPWASERSVVRWDAGKVATHGERWRAIAREAAKQSRRAWLPEVADPSMAPPVVGPSGIVLHEGTRDRLGGASMRNGDRIDLVVGPEGGLSEEEVAGFRDRGAIVVGLGDQILRAETAALVGATLVLAHLGRLG